MESILAEAIDLLKRLPEKGVEKALEALREIKRESDHEKKETVPPCPHCDSADIARNGHKHGKQAYVCRGCGKSFVETAKTCLFNSRSGEAVWKQVVRDTVNGVSIDKTAEALSLHHETVFNMRHKILFCLEEEGKRNPVRLEGARGADETYVPESYKGEKLPSDFWRGPRKHGAVAAKPGLSREYVCVCAGVEREGGAVSEAVNRATAGKDDIQRVFGGRVSNKTVILSDGAKGYGVLEESGKCAVMNAGKEADSFFNINTVNGFHSFMKERNRSARGFATKYLNRYNALFSKVFRASKAVVDDIYTLLCDMNSRYHTIRESQTQNVLRI
jgi:transposase-like protein